MLEYLYLCFVLSNWKQELWKKNEKSPCNMYVGQRAPPEVACLRSERCQPICNVGCGTLLVPMKLLLCTRLWEMQVFAEYVVPISPWWSPEVLVWILIPHCFALVKSEFHIWKVLGFPGESNKFNYNNRIAICIVKYLA